jgi:hypothetical protein
MRRTRYIIRSECTSLSGRHGTRYPSPRELPLKQIPSDNVFHLEVSERAQFQEERLRRLYVKSFIQRPEDPLRISFSTRRLYPSLVSRAFSSAVFKSLTAELPFPNQEVIPLRRPSLPFWFVYHAKALVSRNHPPSVSAGAMAARRTFARQGLGTFCHTQFHPTCAQSEKSCLNVAVSMTMKASIYDAICYIQWSRKKDGISHRNWSSSGKQSRQHATRGIALPNESHVNCMSEKNPDSNLPLRPERVIRHTHAGL